MGEAENVTWRVAVGDAETTAVLDSASADGRRVVFVCAHGAGGNRDDRSMLALRTALVRRGIDEVRFNFLYKERGSGRPDPMPKLMETVTAVVDRVRAELKPRTLITGGRAMAVR